MLLSRLLPALHLRTGPLLSAVAAARGASGPRQARRFAVGSAETSADGRVRSRGPGHSGLDVGLNVDGPGKGGATPEELLACSLAASYHRAVRAVVAAAGSPRALHLGDRTSVRAWVNQESAAEPMLARLEVDLDVLGNIDEAAVRAWAAEAQEACPVSAALGDGAAVEVDVTSVTIRSNLGEEHPPQSQQEPAGGAAAGGAPGTIRVLVLGRREDVVRAMISSCGEMGYHAEGGLTNAEAEALLAAGSFNACCIGFRYGDREGQDLGALKAMLEARGLPYATMPPGSKNVRNALQRLGLEQIVDGGDDEEAESPHR